MKGYGEVYLLKAVEKKNEALHHSLCSLRSALEQLWSFKPLVQDYTQHDLDHSKRLIRYIHQLLDCNGGVDELSVEELYVLLAAAYLHDIGMQCDVPEVQRECGIYIDRGVEGYTRKQQSQLRGAHGELMAAWVRYAFNPDVRETDLLLAIKTIPRKLVLTVIDVARHHTGTDFMNCSESFETSSGGKQRCLLLALLLRLADELDIGEDRVDINTVQQFILPPENALYWWLHYLTTIYIDTESCVIAFKITLHNDDADVLGDQIKQIVVERFRKKNAKVVEELHQMGVHILISHRPTVLEVNPAYPRLPAEVVSLLISGSALCLNSPMPGRVETEMSLPQVSDDSLFGITAGKEGRLKAIDRTTSAQGFVGRREIQKVFRQAVEALTQETPEVQPQKQVFLICGEGGMGKTALLSRFAEICHEFETVRFVELDWDKYKDVSSSIGMMDILHGLLADVSPSEIEPYYRLRQEVLQVRYKVDRLRAEFAKVTSRVTLGSGIEQSRVHQIYEVIDKLKSKAERDKTEFGAWLEPQLTRRELLLASSREAQEALSVRFVDCLIHVAERQPIVVMLDTLEVVERVGGPWVRDGLILHSIDRTPRVLFVLSGRRNLEKEYLRRIQEEWVYSKELDVFTPSEIEDYLRVRQLPTDDEYIEKILQSTLGVPFGVEMMTHTLRKAVKQGTDIKSVFADTAVKDRSNVISALTERFLKYCLTTRGDETKTEKEEKELILDRIFTLALLRRYESAVEMEYLLCHIWRRVHQNPVTHGSAARILRDMQYEFSFVFSGDSNQMHPEVRACIRTSLRHKQWQFGGNVTDINRAALEYFATKLSRAEAGRQRQDFYYDLDWQGYKLDYLNHLFYLDEREALRDLANTIIYADLYVPTYRDALLRFLEEEDLVAGMQPEHKDAIVALTRTGDLSRYAILPQDALQQVGSLLEGWLERNAKIARRLSEIKRDADRGQLETALRKLRQLENICQAGEMAADRADIHMAVARALAQRGQSEIAIETAQVAVMLDGHNKYAQTLLADLLQREERFEDALVHYDQALSIDPDFTYARTGLDRAEGVLDTLSEHPEYKEAKVQTLSKLVMVKGNRLSGLGAIEKAVESYSHAAYLDPSNFEARIKLGNALRQLGKLDDAVDVLEKTLKYVGYRCNAPSSFYTARTNAAIGAARYLHGDYVNAAQSYMAAIEQQPGYANAHIGLGKVRMWQSRTSEAKSELSHGLKIQPLAYWAWMDLALVQMLLGEKEEALHSVEKSLAICKKMERQKSSRLFLVFYISAVDYFVLGKEAEGTFALKRALDGCAAPGLIWESINNLRIALSAGGPSSILEEALAWLEHRTVQDGRRGLNPQPLVPQTSALSLWDGS